MQKYIFDSHTEMSGCDCSMEESDVGTHYLVTEVDVLMEEKDNDIQLLGDSLNGLNEEIAAMKADGDLLASLVTENALLKDERDALLLHPSNPGSPWQGINKEVKLWEIRAIQAEAENQRQDEEIAKLIKTDGERLQTITAYYPIVDGLRKQIAAMKTTIEKYKAGLMEKETYCVGCSLPTDLAVKIGEINILACLIARKALKEPEVKG